MPTLLAGSTDRRRQPQKIAVDSQACAQHDLRFPLSSPMSDDPISPDMDDTILAGHDIKPSASLRTDRSPPRHTRRQGPPIGRLSGEEDGSHRPKIKVVTDMPVQGQRRLKQADSAARNMSKPKQSTGFITLADLSTTASQEQPASKSRWRRRRKDHESPAENRPELVIPPQDVNPVGATSSHDMAATPSILITPAKEEVPRLLQNPSEKTTRPRARSSVYSQPSPGVFYGDISGDVPPMPNIRPEQLEGSYNPFLSPTSPDRRSVHSDGVISPQTAKHLSDHTLCANDDEDMPAPKRPRSTSAPSYRALSERTSFGNRATQYRSRGWWNVILSPFLTRSSTYTTYPNGLSDSPPALPSAVGAAKQREKRESDDSWAERRLSALSPASPLSNEDQASTWRKFSSSGPYHSSDQHGGCHPDSVPRAGRVLAPEESIRGDPSLESRENVAQPTGPQLLQDHVFSPSEQDSPPDASNGAAAAMRRLEGDSPRSGDRACATTPPEHAVPGAWTSPSKSRSPVEENQTHREKDRADTYWPQPPPYSPPRSPGPQPRRPGNAARGFTAASHRQSQPDSPDSVSPGMQHAMTGGLGEPRRDAPPAVRSESTYQRSYLTRANESSRSAPRQGGLPMTLRNIDTSSRPRERIETTRQGDKERYYYAEKGGGDSGRGGGRGCCGTMSRRVESAAEARKRRRKRCCIGLTVGAIIMIAIIVALAMTITRKPKQDDMKPSRWLNITGWPPVPTGVSTVAQPDAAVEDSGCVFPNTKWSCALPKEQQQAVRPNAPDQPNFRLEIMFRNDSSTNTTLSHGGQKRSSRLLRRASLVDRDAADDASWASSPAAPSIDDLRFMGNTTDNITSSLKEGEVTPFYISFLSTTATTSSPSTASGLQKRKQQASSTSNPFPDPDITIPPPDGDADGTPAPANLVTFPALQPLRLYDRGLATEHYGFYNYFDRSIFLKSSALQNQSESSTASGLQEDPDDQNGGSAASDAAYRCTWAQTRFLVQIWTRRSQDPLLPNATATSTSSSAPPSATSTSTASTANDFTRPGSFPYPLTLTLDRHGGDITKKMIYCYALDSEHHLVADNRTIQIENRGFGGRLLGGGQGPLGRDRVSIQQGGWGGIDGGTGGCSCRWENFVDGGS